MADCTRCAQPFDTTMRAPHVLVGCGHSVCARCLAARTHEDRMACAVCARVSIPPAGYDTMAPPNHVLLDWLRALHHRIASRL